MAVISISRFWVTRLKHDVVEYLIDPRGRVSRGGFDVSAITRFSQWPTNKRDTGVHTHRGSMQKSLPGYDEYLQIFNVSRNLPRWLPPVMNKS